MSDIQLSSEMTVDLVRHCAADEYVIQAAQVSVRGENDPDLAIGAGLDPQRFLNALMTPRHGVPWEHVFFTFFVEVPIFVQRQWVKHRLSSMNEMSGRYTELIPKFYVPEETRPMINEGSKMHPRMVQATYMQHQAVVQSNEIIARDAWRKYQTQIKMGIAEEIARTVLPVSIYTRFYWSLNGRSLLNFLERRVDSEANRVPTHPQWEIQMGAEKLEEHFKTLMPLSHNAFVLAGRVAP